MTDGLTFRCSASSVWLASKISRHLRIVGPGSRERVISPAIFSAIRSLMDMAGARIDACREKGADARFGGGRLPRSGTVKRNPTVTPDKMAAMGRGAYVRMLSAVYAAMFLIRVAFGVVVVTFAGYVEADDFVYS